MESIRHSSRLKDLYIWRILLIDDDEDDYVLVRQMLSEAREGKSTLEWASSFEAGKRTLEGDRSFDAVIVDYDMGIHTGIEIIRDAVSKDYPAPLLLFTGRGTYEIDVEAMEAGAADYLSKGEVNAVFLERAIRYAIERKKSELAIRNGEAELRKSEANLRESKERYQDLFNCMLNGFAVHEMIYDADGIPVDYRFLDINPAFEKLVGFTRSEIIGKTVKAVMPGIDPVWIETYGNVARTGEAVQFENYATPLGKYYQVYAFCPRKNHFATIFSDVTEQHNVERSLRESEQRFRAIFENRHSAMLLINPVTADIEDVNDAACSFYGWSREKMVGMKITDLNQLPTDQIQSKLSQANSTTTSVRFHFQHQLANGEIRDVEVRSGPVQIGDRQLLFSIIFDITEHVKTQQALHRSEEMFASAFHSSPAAHAITRLSDGKFLNVNDSLCQMIGYPREDLIVRTAEDVGIYRDAEERRDVMRRIQGQGSLHNFEKAIMNRFGELKTALVSIDPIEVGQEACLLVSLIDITERKRVEEAVKASEQKFSIIFNKAAFPATLSKLTDGSLVDVNEAWEKVFGYTRQEALGKTTVELNINLDQKVRARILDQLRLGQSVRDIETTLTTHSGEQRYFSINIDLVEMNGEKYILNMAQDITERKQINDELQKSEAALRQSVASEQARANELEMLMDAVPAMIWISRDAEAREVIGNRFGNEFLRMRQGANISESAPEHALQEQPYRSFRNGQEIPPDELPIQVASATGLPARNYELDMVFKDGSTSHLVGNVNPLFNEEGIPCGAVGAFTDVTTLRRLEAEKIEAKAQIEVQNRLMAQREQERQSFARDIHDGPIQTLSSTAFHLQMIKDVFTDQALQVELSQIGIDIKNSIQELRAVINELRPPALMHFGLSRVIRIYTEDMREQHPEIEFNLDVMEDAKILSDQTCLSLFRIYQAGINNIFKHSGASKVWVTYHLDRDTFVITLRDNGVGFKTPKDFSQLTRAGHFGLVGMKERAESVGGDFSVISEPGKGTTITVKGPLLGKNLK